LKNFTWRAILVAAVVLAAIVILLPTFQESMWPHTKINLGLDLQGGMHLALEVQADKAVDSTMDRVLQDFREELRKARVRHKDLELVNQAIRVRLLGAEAQEEFQVVFDREFPNLQVDSKSPDGEDLVMRITLPDAEKARIREFAVAQAIETIRNRVDQFGVSEADIRRQGQRRILIQLPGIKDPERAKALVGRTAQLQFRLLDETGDLKRAEEGYPPPDSEVMYEKKVNRETGRTVRSPYLVKKKTLMTGEYLKDARVSLDSQYGDPYVSLEFDSTGARLFERITGEYVGKRLAIILDDTVYSAPVIRERISGGSAMIEGSFTDQDAKDLVIVLRAGALPAPVKVIEERTVGPSLGHDSIRTGFASMLIGGVLVILFMAVYYLGAGLIADLALLLNIILIAAGLAVFGATLTLPGIAGVILTIGMAVDANVLVFERIREELRIGKTPGAAVDSGFSKATITILDANVTTLVAALVLFQFGTGPVKGFAVTLSIGIVASFFTAVFVSRVVFDYFLFFRQVRKLSI